MAATFRTKLAFAALAFTIALLPPDARADDAYYMVVFAYQGKPNLPRLAHTFATFVKVPEHADGTPNIQEFESHTISWLAATNRVVLLRPRAEAGANLDLTTTLQLAVAQDAEISAWGPYRIRKELYERGLAQIERLNSGRIGYKAVDTGLRPGIALNCIHGVSDIVDDPLLITATAYGNAASEMVRDHLFPWIIEPKTTHRFLNSPLRLDKYAMTFRD